MFSDTQTITINGVATILNRIGSSGNSSEYLKRTATEEFRLNIRNSSYTDKKRAVLMDRHNVEFLHTIFGIAPAVDTKRKTYFVFENQKGDTLDGPVFDAAGLLNWGIATSNAALTKLVNYES